VSLALGVSAGLGAGGIIAAFHSLALFIESPLLAWSERVSVRCFSSLSLATLALAMLGAGLAESSIAFAVCLALYGPASGCALAASEGALVESCPSERERTLARLSLAGAGGDLAVPLLLAALAWLGHGWRAAFITGALVTFVLALIHASANALDARLSLEPQVTDAEPASVYRTLKAALSTRPLVAWSAAAALTSLLDEVLIAFAVVQLQHASPVARATAVGAWTIGILAGLFLLERFIERLDSRRVLLASCAGAAASLCVLAITPDVPVAIGALFALGTSTSTLHPLASARAYASLPGRPALVNAVAAAFAPFDLLAPLALAALAVWLGPPAALLALLVAPLGIAWAAYRAR
jgi:MFS family permease